MQRPKNVKDLRSFLGLCNYYRGYIDNYARKCHCLYALLLHNAKFKWKSREEEVFQELKSLFAQAPILQHPNFQHPFTIRMEASGTGLGAVLLQFYDNDMHTIQYISRVLRPSETKWHIQELEALAIVWSLEMLKPYVIGSRFTVQTDHRSLQWMKTSTKDRIQRWAMYLSEFDFKLEYKPGKGNAVADALSRMPIENAFDFGDEEVIEKLVD
jgi:hypothetical protein